MTAPRKRSVGNR